MKESTRNPYTKSVRIKYSDGTSTLERIPSTFSLTGKEKVHTLLEGETLQSVAFRYYGDSGLWADIADANNIIDPFTEVYRGKQLIIPNP